MKLTAIAIISTQLLVTSAGLVVHKRDASITGDHTGNVTTRPVNTTSTGTPGNATITTVSWNATTTANPVFNATNILPSTTTTSVGQEIPTEAAPFPVWNLNNSTCEEIDDLPSNDQWAIVKGDETIQQFEKMLSQNLLYCKECYGNTKGNCTSDNTKCQQGLADRAKQGLPDHRWDVGVGAFNDINTLFCGIGESGCSEHKLCKNADGPGAWALAESLVNLNNLYNNIFNAIESAGQTAGNQMRLFQEVFAPMPKDKTFLIDIFSSIASGLLGFIPGAGEVIGALFIDVGSAVLTEVLEQDPFDTPDTGPALSLIVQSIQETYQNLTNSLFKTGRYNYTSTDGHNQTLSLANLMKNGASLDPADEAMSSFTTERNKYQTIIFQQLALFTWQNLQTDKVGHVPFIGFDPFPCTEVEEKMDQSVIRTVFKHEDALKSAYEHKGFCYYILDGSPIDTQCGTKTLPGGTIKSMQENESSFRLLVEDFVIPSVEGWLANNKDHALAVASSKKNKLFKDPRSPGAVNLPICDYKGNPKSPGVGCPIIGGYTTDDNKCQTYAANSQDNPPGVSNPGRCGLHIVQYQRRSGNLNPTDVYQLEISVFDDLGRKVGFATKQPAFAPLEVQGSLPYNLIAAPGNLDDDPISFWYSDSFWTSSDDQSQCSVGSYDQGSRQMDCGFQCPVKGDNPPVSATGSHQLPAAPTKAIAGPSSFLNTFTSTTQEPTPTPSPTYERGKCGFHLTQWQKNEPGRNEHSEYAIEMTIQDNSGRVIGASGKILTPFGQQTQVQGGLEHYILINPGRVDEDPFTMEYAGSRWDTNGSQCSVGAYDSGKREMDCKFDC